MTTTPTITAATHWAQTTRLVPAAKVTARMVALALAVKAAFLAVLLPGSTPAPLVHLAALVGIPAERLTGWAWPVMNWLTGLVGLPTAAGLAVAALLLGTVFLLLRRNLVQNLADALQ